MKLQPSFLSQSCTLAMLVSTAFLVTACGGSSSDSNSSKKPITKSPLIGKPQAVKTFSTKQLNKLAKSQSAKVTVKCDVKVEKFTYQTQGSAGEITTATSALMLPTGEGKDCSGKRPVFLYAHGTTVEKSYDLSQVGNAKNPAGGQATELATLYASQGYVVVAPNYAGYDKSTLDYHPYLNKKQQTLDMYDALKSARQIVQNDKNVSLSDKLFIAGYSQGGFVAMATAEYLQNQGKKVTAVAPSSGPYAMLAFGDVIFSGMVNYGATMFAPLLATSYQKQYGNIYSSPSELYSKKYANTAPTAMPSELSVKELTKGANKKIPALALFQSNTGNPMLEKLPKKFPFFFNDKDYLVNTAFRLKYLADMQKNPDSLTKKPQNTFRQALQDNDLRTFVPKMPVFLCGGNQDPMVFFDVNTSKIANIWKNKADLDITVLDVDNTNAMSRNNMPTLQFIGKASKDKRNMEQIAKNVQQEFATDIQKTFQASGELGMLMNYHGVSTHKACMDATRQYFNQF